MTFQHIGHLLLEIFKFEWRQEAKRTQMECHHWRHRVLEEQRGIEQCAVATETDYEIDAIS